MRTRELILSLIAGLTLLAGAVAQPKGDEKKPDPKPAEQKKPAPAADSLEGLIADAMKHNPDVQSALAKVREAEANLNKVRSEVMVQLAAQREVVRNAKEMLKSVEELHRVRQETYKKGN